MAIEDMIEYDLWTGVIEKALEDFKWSYPVRRSTHAPNSHDRRKLYRITETCDPEYWLFGKGSGFDAVCDRLGINPERIRSGFRSWVKSMWSVEYVPDFKEPDMEAAAEEMARNMAMPRDSHHIDEEEWRPPVQTREVESTEGGGYARRQTPRRASDEMDKSAEPLPPWRQRYAPARKRALREASAQKRPRQRAARKIRGSRPHPAKHMSQRRTGTMQRLQRQRFPKRLLTERRRRLSRSSLEAAAKQQKEASSTG